MSKKDEKFRKSYEFFLEKEKSNKQFNLEELRDQTGWSNSTVKTYVTKKWDSILKKRADNKFIAKVSHYQLPAYIKMMSQNNKSSQNPFKPDLDEKVEGLVIKSRESALLALDIYNRPMTTFKSEGFIVMMIIAWTSLLHAIFERDGKKYNDVDKDGKDILIDGDPKCWELSRCIKEFFKAGNDPVSLNIKFMIDLRNKIEHRFLPKIDNHVGGESQALLLNFDDLLTKEFSSYYSLREILVFPLQTTNLRHDTAIETVKKFQGKNYDSVKGYIEKFRGNISEEIYNDPRYSFRVYLMPKTGNHKNSSDASMEFIHYDVNNKEVMDSIEKHITIIKEKNVQVANQGLFKPTAVVNFVKENIKRPFTMPNHTSAYKFYEIRTSPKTCNVQYCQYDEPHKDYIYTQKWMDFLVEKLSDENEYQKVIKFGKS